MEDWSIRDIFKISSCFNSIHLYHISKELNVEAHSFVRFGLSLDDFPPTDQGCFQGNVFLLCSFVPSI